MTYDFYVLLKFITQHKFNIKLPVDNDGKEKPLKLFTINNPELDELKKLPKAPTAKVIGADNTEQTQKRTCGKKNIELPVVDNQVQNGQNEQNEQNEQNDEQNEQIQNDNQNNDNQNNDNQNNDNQNNDN